MSEETENPELQAFETALTSLRPTPSAVDRDRIMFASGRKAGRNTISHRRRGPWLWPLATIATGIVAFACGMTISPSPQPQIVQRTVYVEKNIWPTIEEVSEPIREKRLNPFGLAQHTSRSWAFNEMDRPERVRLLQREITQPMELLNRPIIRAHSIRDLEGIMGRDAETSEQSNQI